MSEYLKMMREKGFSDDEITALNWKEYNELVQEIKDEPEPRCVPCPYKGLSDLNGGFEPGRLYVLGAPPKQGKTALAMSLIYNLSKLGGQSLLFSYEVGWKNVVRTFMSMEKHDGKEVGTLPVPVYVPIELHREGGKIQLQWLREAIEVAKDKGVDFIAIDYLHFLIPYQVTQNFSIVIGNVVREIKRIAVETDMPILLIVAMKKIDGNRKPNLWDIRDSSMIMHEADDIMIMYRLTKKDVQQINGTLIEENSYSSKQDDNKVENPYSNYSVLSLEMSRKRGASGGIYLAHNGAYFEEVPKEALI